MYLCMYVFIIVKLACADGLYCHHCALSVPLKHRQIGNLRDILILRGGRHGGYNGGFI